MGMNEDEARNALERMYWANRNWRSSVRSKIARFLVQAAQSSSIEEQLETLRNNANTQKNILQGKAIQNESFVCEFCQGSHFSGECFGGRILTIPKELEQVEAASMAPIDKLYNPIWQKHPNFNWRPTPPRKIKFINVLIKDLHFWPINKVNKLHFSVPVTFNNLRILSMR